ncbi:hypothetical protein [Burkholderia cenocepacia]|uniref:hypothetical protein n=1 Tax=Burkholderia cenocepacia TaxID=95486 RepID=UPI000F5A6824|nr:hypothetical protein [Burkholderia cenocepacia]
MMDHLMGRPCLPAKKRKREDESTSVPGNDKRMTVGKKYVFFPILDGERIRRLWFANQSRAERGKNGYIPVFRDARQRDSFREQIGRMCPSPELEEHVSRRLRYQDAVVGATQPEGLRPLASLSVFDKLYVNSHGLPGNVAHPFLDHRGGDHFFDEGTTFETTQNVAQTLVELGLPSDVEVRVSVCWSAAASPIAISNEMRDAARLGIPARIREMYDFIDSRRGGFQESLAGSLEQHLLRLQAHRAPGMVSGYLGNVTFPANDCPKIRKVHPNSFATVNAHASAYFGGTDDAGQTATKVAIRKSDFRRTALDEALMHTSGATR